MILDPKQAAALREQYLTIVDGLEGYLQYRKDLGDTHLPVSDQPHVGRHPQLAVAAESAPVSAANPPSQSPDSQLDAIIARVAACTLCSLCKERTNTVPGQGNPTPELMFVGEGPGANEDEQGLAFVGRAGNLLTKMIDAMGLSRDEVFITNIVKCRPPGNRNPAPDEMTACMPYLHEQIAILKPKVIVALGSVAVKGLLDVSTGITKLRGNWHTFQGIDMMPTYHPAYLLRNPPKKKEVWEDLKDVLRRLDRPVPSD